MAATVHGSSLVVFNSVPVLTGYTVQGYTKNISKGLTIEVFDETGKRVGVKYDDTTKEISIEALFIEDIPTVGGTFSYDGELWECLSVELKGNNKSSTVVTIKGKNSEGVALD